MFSYLNKIVGGGQKLALSLFASLLVCGVWADSLQTALVNFGSETVVDGWVNQASQTGSGNVEEKIKITDVNSSGVSVLVCKASDPRGNFWAHDTQLTDFTAASYVDIHGAKQDSLAGEFQSSFGVDIDLPASVYKTGLNNGAGGCNGFTLKVGGLKPGKKYVLYMGFSYSSVNGACAGVRVEDSGYYSVEKLSYIVSVAGSNTTTVNEYTDFEPSAADLVPGTLGALIVRAKGITPRDDGTIAFTMMGNKAGINFLAIREMPPVAKIGDNEYYTLRDAVTAAQNGDIIDLMANSTDQISVVGKAIGIRLNGKTWDASVKLSADTECYVPIKNGSTINSYVVGDFEKCVGLLENGSAINASNYATSLGINSNAVFFYINKDIRLTKDLSLPDYGASTSGICIAAGKTVTIDLDGHTIAQDWCTGKGQAMFVAKGVLTICGEGQITANNWAFQVNNKLILDGPRVTMRGDTSGSSNMAYYVMAYDGGDFVMRSGEFCLPSRHNFNSSSIFVARDFDAGKSGATFVVEGGSLLVPMGFIYQYSSMTISNNVKFPEYYILVNGGVGLKAIYGPLDALVNYNSLSDTFDQAFTDAEDGDSICLLGNVTLTDSLKIGKEIVLDLNGYSLVSPDGSFAENAAAFCADGYEAVDNGEGIWSIRIKLVASTFDVTLVAGEAVPVAMPFGKGSVAWREVLADSGLSVGTTVKVPAANGNYAGYSLDANGWQCTTEGITADTVATGDAIWVTLPKEAGTKSITLSGSVSAIEQPVIIKEGTNLVCFPTAADVDVNATAIAWTDDVESTNPHDMDRIETRDLETGKGRVLFYLGDGKWGENRYDATGKPVESNTIIKKGQGFLYLRHGVDMPLPSAKGN